MIRIELKWHPLEDEPHGLEHSRRIDWASGKVQDRMPALERHSAPNSPPGWVFVNCSPLASVGLGGAAGIPPNAAQVPMAKTYSALFPKAAMRSFFGCP